jgi:hypothetical protein
MISAACHIHSDWSYDGKWPLEAFAPEFRRRGYRVLMITEHDRGFTEARRLEHRAACAAASAEDLLLVPGIEYSDAANQVHVLVWGSVPFVGEGVPTTDLLKAVKAANGVAVLAHPSRRKAWQVFNPTWANHLLGIELWNRKTDGWAPSQNAMRLLQDTELAPFAGMDFHNRKQLFPLSMELDLTGEVSESSVLDCLRARQFRAMAFGRSIERVTEGWFRLTLRSAERCRRSAAAAYRCLRS